MGVSTATQDAIVINLVGQLKAKDGQGNIRELTIGDLIEEGEQLIFSATAQFNLQMADGSIINEQNIIPPEPEQALPDDLQQALTAESEVFGIDDEIAAIQAQILAGDDPTLDLPATAAGAGTGGNEGGSGFITLGRSADETLADSGYDTNGFAGAPATEIDPTVTTDDPTLPTISSSSVTLAEANLAAGSAPLADALIQTNTISFTTDNGIENLTINGNAIFAAGVFTGPISFASANGVLTISAFDPSTNTLTYTYQLSSPLNNLTTDTITETFALELTDELGNSASSTISVNILDDAPSGENDANNLDEDTISVTGNVLNNDTQGADTATLSLIVNSDGVSQTLGQETVISGSFGVLQISADGSYTYLLTTDSADVQSLSQGELVTDSFSYQLLDADGDIVTLTLSIDITGTNDAPIITTTFGEASGVVIESGNEDDGTIIPGEPVVGGTLTATDIDNGAQLSWSFTPQTNNFGSFSLDSTTGVWSYQLDNTLADSLAEGQSAQESFLVTITDEFGATDTQLVTITVQGTNDSPVITSTDIDASGTVTEAGNEDNGAITAGVTQTSGLLTASDIDDGAIQTWSFVPQSNNFGSFNINTATGQWRYNLDNELADSLAEGQTASETFLVTVVDEFGATDTQIVTVTVTVQGTNDSPVITSTSADAIGTVIEAGSEDDGTPIAGTAQVNGTLTVSDVDSGASHIWSFDPQANEYGTFAIDPTTGAWTYSLDNELADSLAENQQVQETFLVTVTDEFGAVDTQLVTVTVQGTNDSPVITSSQADASGSVIESGNLDDGTVVDGVSQTGGTLTASDVDSGATQSWSFSAQTNLYGTFSLNAATGEWTYILDNTLADSLSEGEFAQETFLVTVTDEFGATDTQLVTVSVQGTNDSPVITSNQTEASGEVVETGNQDDGTVIAGTTQISGDLGDIDIDSGTIETWSFVPQSNEYGTFTLDPDTGGWVYDLDESIADTLPEGESVEEQFLVTVEDQFGAVDTIVVTITVQGTNDSPIIFIGEGDSASGTVIEAGNLDDGTLVPGTASIAGTLSVSDVDTIVTDNPVWSFAPQTNAYGTFSIDSATGAWQYNLNNSAADNLAEGQSAIETFLVTVTDEFGATDTQVITITVQGTNDAPVITSDTESATGAVLEAGVVDGGNDIEPGILQTSGTVTASDVDLGSSLSWGGNAQGVYGSFTIDPNSGSWNYTLNNSALVDSLASGEQHNEIFLVTVTDEFGAIATQEITITVTGSNDVPVLTLDDTGGLTKDISEPNLSDSGLLSFTDVDNGDTHTVTESYNGNLVWSAGQISDHLTNEEINSLIDGFSVNNNGWDYTALNSLFQFLGEGETITLSFDVTVTDNNGANDTETVNITIFGNNDLPTLSVEPLGSVTEDFTNPNLSDTGSLSFTDPNATDTHTVTEIYNGDIQWSGGTLDAQLSEAEISTLIDGFSVDSDSWDYSIPNALVQFLAVNETITLSFNVTVTDNRGGSDTELVTITINGANDIPSIEGTSNGDVQEDVAVVPTSTLTANGSGSFNDIDITDSHTMSSLLTSAATWSGGLLSDELTNQQIDDLSSGFSAQIDSQQTDSWSWDYTVNNDLLQFLAQGQNITMTFTVTIDDGNGGTNAQEITITITGTNDDPVISIEQGDSASGTVIEAGNLDDGTIVAGTDTVSGTLSVSDVDSIISDNPIWSFAAQTNLYGNFSINAATGAWQYNLDNSAADSLAEGQSAIETFLVTVTDEFGATDTQVVTVTVQGTNDSPILFIDTNDSASGTVVEAGNLDDGTIVAGTDTVSGTLSVSDVDSIVTNNPIWSFAAQTNLYGTFSINAATGAWQYNLDNSAADSLAEGQSAQETFLVTVTDEFGATDTQVVTITVQGTNDSPVLSIEQGDSASGTVIEAGNLDDGTVVAGAAMINGTLSVSDVDSIVTNNPIWSFAAQTNLYGTFSINAATGAWEYELDNSAADSLAEGQSAQETFLVTVTDEFGATDTQVVTVTVQGTNDSPILFIDTNDSASGTVVEAGNLDDGTIVAGTDTVSGTLSVSDVDSIITNYPIWSFAAQTSLYGTFSINAATGAWQYNLDNSAADSLAEGQSAIETFLVTVTDEFGATDTQVVTVTVQGTNDSPVLSIEQGDSASGTVVEAGNLDDGTIVAGTDTVSGTLSVSDVDSIVTNNPIWSFAAQTNLYGTFSINAATGAWEYELDNSAADSLAEGQSAIETFLVTVTDEFGATDTQVVTVTVQGTNDSPILFIDTNDSASGTVVEAGNLDDGTIVAGTDTISGTLSVSDVDSIVTNNPIWSFAAQTNLYGTFSINAATGAWEYELDNSAADSLAEGQSAQETFLVTVTDEFGATDTQVVTVTVQGTNDSPILFIDTNDSASGTVVEAGNLDDGTIVAGTDTVSGTLSVSDVDSIITNNPIWSFAAQTSLYGTFSINAATGAWQYNLDNSAADSLAEGQSAIETFLVTVTDEFGATDTQMVTVTVQGTNDSPVLTVNDLAAEVTEDASSPMLTDSGSLSFTDVDLTDTHTVSEVHNNNISWTGGDITSVLTAQQITDLIDGFSVDSDSWDYNIANSLVQFLAIGESITLSFDVTVTDINGATDTETVTVTINGTNDPLEGDFQKDIWMPAALEEIVDPYTAGYPLLLTAPSDVDTNDSLTITVSMIPTEGEVGYYDGNNIFVSLEVNDVITSDMLTNLVYMPSGNITAANEYTLSFTMQSGSEEVITTYNIHTIPPTSLPGQSVQIGDGSSPLTSGNDQDAQLVLNSNFASNITNNPDLASLVLFTDFQKSPFDTPIPANEIGGTAGTEREDEVSIRLTINGIVFVVLAAANGVTDWFYDVETGLMRAEFDYSIIVQESDPSITLIDYINSNNYTPAGGDIWTITYLDNDGGSYQARFVQANFVFDSQGDPSLTITGTAGVDNLLFGGTSHDTLTGAELNDRIFAREGDDLLDGADGDDELVGGSGNDTITGGAGNDYLNGGADNDVLDGGTGSDILIGGMGSDTLDAGLDSDNDTFIWQTGDADASSDTVQNFNLSHDILDLSEVLLDEENNSLESYFTFNFVGGSTIITVDTNGALAGGDTVTITLENVDLSQEYGDINETVILDGLLFDEAIVVDLLP
ncbi:retention module-containing protein [Shewanella woodyi]|uniref:retention module-containing protein n=1 Tax=Shewanella woodyi TaxID=60961 RepID=UPI0007F95D96|nr:retention module-containing protein [Shewanella woodyi]